MRWSGGERVLVFAFAAFNAQSAGVTDVRLHADASRRATTFHAFRWYLWVAMDQEWQRGSTGGQAVQLVTAFGVDFAIGGAFAFDGFDFGQDHVGWSNAVGNSDADALIISQITFFAEATDDAVASADRARMGVGAGGRAGSTAWHENLVGWAFRDWWEHHERFRLSLSSALTGFNAFASFRSDKTLFAGTAGNANTGAHWIRVLARAIASFALTVFFIVAAELWWHGDGIFWADTAIHRCDANALFVLQITGFAEAADDAVLGAHGARMGIRAGGGACGAAWHEEFVFFALRNFWWVGEEHVRLSDMG